jgi:hypothetical protein
MPDTALFVPVEDIADHAVSLDAFIENHIVIPGGRAVSSFVSVTPGADGIQFW